jgi:hypothetical protein
MRFQQLPDGSLIDEETGEILDKSCGTFIFIPSRIKLREGWFMAFQDAFESLATDKELWGQPTAVLHYLMSKLSFDNFIAVEQVEIATKLSIEKTRVSESIRKLVDKGILEKGPRLGKSWSYRLNHMYGWKGRVKNLKEERKKKLSVIDGGKK